MFSYNFQRKDGGIIQLKQPFINRWPLGSRYMCDRLCIFPTEKTRGWEDKHSNGTQEIADHTFRDYEAQKHPIGAGYFLWGMALGGENP